VQPDDLLLEVVLAFGAVRGFANLLDRGQEQRDQDANDGNHHQQLDQGKRTTAPGRKRAARTRIPARDETRHEMTLNKTKE
jgi:hypothetical protein